MRIPVPLSQWMFLAFGGWLAAAAEAPPDFLWTHQAGGKDTDAGCGVAVDNSGNVFVTGYFFGTNSFGATNLISAGEDDIFVAKYDSAGNLLWARRAGGSASDEGLAVAADAAGNAFVTGLFQGTASFGTTNLTSSGQSDIFLAKYGPAGTLLWARKAGGNDFDEGHGLALDAAGDAYLTGYCTGTAAFGSINPASLGGSNNMFVAKCSSAGTFLWVRRAGGDSDDQGNAIAVDAATNVYVTGAFADNVTFANTNLSGTGTNGALDVFVAKYDSAGNFLWARKGGGSDNDQGYAIVADAAGNSYVAGQIFGTAAFSGTNVAGNGLDIFLSKYDGSGNLLWVRKAGGNNAIYGDGGFGVTLDPAGNVCVCGYFSGTANLGSTNIATSGFDDVFIAKYDTGGNLLWVRKAGGSNLDVAYAMAADRSGNLFLTGFFSDTAAFGAANLTATGPSPVRDIFITRLGVMAPPLLAISRAGDNLQLAWPASAADFLLESATVPTAPTWSTVLAPTNLVGSSRIVIMTNSNPKVFYRLRK